MPSLSQRGAALITAIFIIVVLSLLASAATFLRVSDTASNLDYQAADQAFFLAESGLEQAGLSLWNGTACTAVALGPTALGRGTYTIISGTVIATGCQVRARGNVGATVRTLEGDFSPAFVEHFPDAANFAAWTVDTTTNTSANAVQGYSTLLGNAPGSTGGHILGQPNTTGAGDHLVFTATRALGAAAFVATGTTNLSFYWRKTNQNLGGGKPHLLRINAMDTTNAVHLLWEDTLRRADAGWIAQGPTVPTPAAMVGRTIDRIQLFFDLQEQGNNTISGAFDFIQFGNLTLTGWREIVF